MPKVIILKGLPASGKSTWAKAQVDKSNGKVKRVNKDDLRAMIDNGKWSKNNEAYVLMVRDHIITSCLHNGYDVIVDDTNLDQKHEIRIRAIAEPKYAVEVNEDFTNVPVEECIARDLKRERSVGERVIRDMHDKYIRKPSEIVQTISLPGAYIFDIDGTLAKMNDRRPYEWERVGEDSPNYQIVTLARTLKSSGNHIIIVSGRDGSCRPQTEKWLKDHRIEYTELHMREAGNNEKDFIIKRAILEDIITRYYVEAAFDDRDQVVEMWRDAGLTCLQVNKGNF